MSGRLTGKRALVTGAAQGIGAAVAEAFAREGAKVLLTDIDGAAVTQRANDLSMRFPGTELVAMRHDVTVEAHWVEATRRAQADLGGLSVLVNNSGLVVAGGVEDLSLSEWWQGMATNCDSVFLGCKASLPLLRESQPASIVNISAKPALTTGRGLANYDASRGAAWLLCKSIALDCAHNGLDIRCNSVQAAFIGATILSEIGEPACGEEASVMAGFARQVPLGRLGQASDVADAVLYLASDESRFVTATELKVDGGASAM